MKKATVIFLVLGLCACSAQDSDYYPYMMKGLGVWVTDNETGNSHYVGFVEGNYLNKQEAVSSCGGMAYSFAEMNYMKDFGYVCCTVTSDSDCVTKVR